MPSKNKQRIRFERYSTLIKSFCDGEIMYEEVTKYFNDDIVAYLLDNNIYDMGDFLYLDKDTAREIFGNKSQLFKDTVNVLCEICKKEIPEEYKLYCSGNTYLLIDAFDTIKYYAKHYGDIRISFRISSYKRLQSIFKKAGVKTYKDLYDLGVGGLINLPDFGEKAILEFSKMIHYLSDMLIIRKSQTKDEPIIKKTDEVAKASTKKNASLDSSRIKPVHINAVKKIKKYLDKLIELEQKEFMKKDLKEIGFSAHSNKIANKYGFHNLQDIYNSLEVIIQKYNYTQKNLKNLALNVSNVCQKQIKKVKNKVSKPPSGYKSYNYQYFLNMADWKRKSPTVKGDLDLLVKTKTGFEFYVGTGMEKSIFENLNARPEVYDIRGQDFIINYKGKEGKESEYHPDLIVYYKNGTISLYEVKPVSQMGMNPVLRKYSAMVEYAKKHGFMCEMGGRSSNKAPIKTFDEIKARKANGKYKKYVDNIIESEGYFDKSHLLAYKKKHKLVGNGETNRLYYDLVSMVINDLDSYYMYSQKDKSIYTWRVIKPKFKNRIKL